ncbi:MAG: S8 family serine peptidase [Leptolyngbyaceae cyanobacterium bins.349]|nr:S8 family serine peptidase [Leptolyngbyaceae cyanobacterium bins.349]
MAIDAGNTLNDAFNLGSFNGNQTTQRGESIGTGTDLNDYYRFTVGSSGFIRIRLDGLTDNAELELLNGSGGGLRRSTNAGITPEAIAELLQPGTYYIRVYSAPSNPPTSGMARTPYTLNVQRQLLPSAGFSDDASNNQLQPTDLGIYDSRTTTMSQQAIGGSNPNDYYRFELKEQRAVHLQLNGLGADASLELFKSVHQIVARSYQAGTVAESIRTILDPGIYTLRVFSFGGVATNYNLSISDTDLSVLERLKSPTLIQAGTLGADRFTLTPGYRRYVFSGNGNVDYGSGLFDWLDLSALDSGSVRRNSVRADGTGGVRYNPGNGDRLFDQLLLNDGREILLEGIERILFKDSGSFGSNLINAGLTVNPTDPLFSQQWNLHMTGVHTAWRFTQGSNRVLIGIQDSGLGSDSTGRWHPDLSNTTIYYPNNYRDDYSEQADYSDGRKNSHGTAVQGIISAIANNSSTALNSQTEIAGINWTSPTFTIDVGLDLNDQSLAIATQNQINQATRFGQRLIVNMSLSVPKQLGGRTVPSFDEEPPNFQLTSLIRDNPNVLFVVAAGNDGDLERSGLAYPAVLAKQYGNVIAVGAAWGKTDAFGQLRIPGTRIDYSNYAGLNFWGSQYGTGLTVMAPSEHITTRATFDPRTGQVTFNTYPNNPLNPLTNSQLRQLQNLDLAFNGTSAAAPNVTGIASLVWSANPTLTAAQVRQILSETAIDLGTPGYDISTGYGFVNADTAVRRAMAIARA